MSLKQALDRFYKEYNFKDRVLHDPIEFPHQYKRPADIEISGFISACFAYGRVELFKPVIKRILSVMGESPYEFLAAFDVKRQRQLFSGVKYRFNNTEDIIALMYVIHKVFEEYGSIKACFKRFYKETDKDIGNALAGLIFHMQGINVSMLFKKGLPSMGFLQFFPTPGLSACKRMNLFLRWMIRDRDIDFGIWKGIPKNKLIIPLDTHIARISKCLGFTKRKSQDWKMAVEITEALKRLDPEDPLKYDFALCHQGIAKVCSKFNCKTCSLTAQNI